MAQSFLTPDLLELLDSSGDVAALSQAAREAEAKRLYAQMLADANFPPGAILDAEA